MTMEPPKPVSVYVIPEGCICMGDGLMGMKCEAAKHAICRTCHAPATSVAELRTLRAQNTRLRALMRELQLEPDATDTPTCRICRQWYPDCAPDCRLAAALKESTHVSE